LSSKDEKELIEIINFPVEGEKIIALSDSWEEVIISLFNIPPFTLILEFRYFPFSPYQ